MPYAEELDQLLADVPTTDDVPSLISQAAKKYGVDEGLARSVAKQESGNDQSQVSRKGAIGVMQLMPDTAKELGVDPANTAQNIDGGVRYLSQLLKKYKGDRGKALAAYNAGPSHVDSGKPLPQETRDYVQSVAPLSELDSLLGDVPRIGGGAPAAAGSDLKELDSLLGDVPQMAPGPKTYPAGTPIPKEEIPPAFQNMAESEWPEYLVRQLRGQPPLTPQEDRAEPDEDEQQPQSAKPDIMGAVSAFTNTPQFQARQQMSPAERNKQAAIQQATHQQVGVVPVAPQPKPSLIAAPPPTGVPSILAEEPPAAQPTPQGPIMLNVGQARNITPPTPMAPVPGETEQAVKDLRNLLLGPAYGAPLRSSGWGESVINALLRATAQFNTPEGIATMAAGAGLAEALPELAKTPDFVAALAEHPNLSKAVDIVSKNATGIGFGAYGVASGTPNLVEGIKSGNMEQAAQGAFQIGLGGLGLGVAALNARKILSLYPSGEVPPAEIPVRPATGYKAEVLEAARPEGVETPATRPNPQAIPEMIAAQQRAQELQQAGQPLSAQQWLRRAEEIQTGLPTQDLTIGDQQFTVRQSGVAKNGRPIYEMLDADGKRVAGGYAGQIRAAVQRRAGEQPALPTDVQEAIDNAGAFEEAVKELAERYRDILTMQEHLNSGEDVQMGGRTMESTTPEQRRQMLADNIQAHQQIYDAAWDGLAKDIGPEAAQQLREHVETTGQQAQAAPAAAGPTQPPPSAVTIEAGATYKTPTGEVQVKQHSNGIVLFDRITPAGTVIPNLRLPLAQFQSMVSAPAPAPSAQAPATAPAQQSPETPVTPQQPQQPATQAGPEDTAAAPLQPEQPSVSPQLLPVASTLGNATGGQGDSANPKGVSNSSIPNTAGTSYLPDAEAIVEHGLSGLNAPSQRIVLSRVVAALHDPQIRNRVIESIPVDVVDYLASLDPDTKFSFHDQGVLVDPLSPDLKDSVSLRSDIANSLAIAVARATTKEASTASSPSSLTENRLSAPSADDLNHNSIVTAPRPERTVIQTNKPDNSQGVARQFSSTQANLPAEVADKATAFGKTIPGAQLAPDGLEAKPHITVKYGLHGEDPAEVQRLLANEKPITVTLGRASIFPGVQTDHGIADVLKVDVDSGDLHRLNAMLARELPHTETYPTYHPHVTLAYLRAGQGAQYNGAVIPGVTGKKVTLDTITFSGKDGKETDIRLGSPKPAENIPENIPSGTSDLQAQIDQHTARAKQLIEEARKIPGMNSRKAKLLDDAQAETNKAAELKKQLEAQPEKASDEETRRSIYEAAVDDLRESTRRLTGLMENQGQGWVPSRHEAALLNFQKAMAAGQEILEKFEAPAESNLKNALESAIEQARAIVPKTQFAEGERVTWKDRRGKPLFGTVTDISETELQVSQGGGQNPIWIPVAGVRKAAPEVAPTARDFGPGDIVRFQGKVYEVGFAHGGLLRLQDPETHEGSVRATPSEVELVSKYESVYTPPEAPGATTGAQPEEKSYRVYVKPRGETEWVPNGLYFPTIEQANKYGSDLYSRWMGAEKWEARPEQHIPNYRWDEDTYKAVSITPEEAARIQQDEAAREAQPPAVRLANAVYDKLTKGQSLGNQTQFYDLAEQFFGSSRASGSWDVKDAMDAMEAGVNRWIIDNGSRLLGMDPVQALAELRNLEALLPTQGTRTEEQLRAQQFSTPPRESFVVAKVANFRPEDVDLEPSAGNGGLAAWPKSIGATVYVNEISDRRAQMLEAAGFGKPTAHDGELINTLLDRSIQPTVITMNPPFSSGALKSHHAKNRNQYGFNHVDQALQRLVPGGRLVAILGGGRADDLNGGASFTGGETGKWFGRIRKLYNIRANVRVNGKEYQKYGTNFATRIIVIDKSGPTPDAVWHDTLLGKGPVIQANVDTLEEAYNVLRGVADDRPTPQVPSRAGSTASAGQGKPGTGVAAGPRAGGKRGGTVLPGGRGTGATSEPANRPAESPGGPGGLQPGASGEPAGVQQPVTGPEAPAGIPGAGGAEGGPESNELRPVSGNGEPGEDLAALGGMSAEDLIRQATEALAQDLGQKPTAPPTASTPAQKPPKAAQPKALKPARAPKAPTTKTAPAPPPQPKSAIDQAADDALADLRAMMEADEGPARLSREGPARLSREPGATPIPAKVLVQLAKIGARQILKGGADFDGWAKRLTEEAGDVINWVAQKAGVTPDQVLKMVHAPARAVAVQFQPLTGDEQTKGVLKLERADRPVSEREDTEAYVAYHPSIKGGSHPGDIVETKTMATVPLPAITYTPHLPPEILKGGISAVQMEAVAIAGQQNEIILPGGFRAAALIGDGTGVGKGREGAAYLWDRWRGGQKRLVWVSEKWDLMQDAMRDLTGIGAAPELLRGVERQPDGKFVVTPKSQIQPFNRWKYGDNIKHDGLIFTTYGTVRAKDKKGNRRVAQLQQYLMGDDEGEGAAIIFDEAHNLKNAVAARGTPPSQIGQAVRQLLQNVPKLRTLSLSATAATDVVNLGYLDRLGLWGPGTPFPNGFVEFQSQIARGGLSAMEMIARELKAQGKYLSRTLSFHGVQYETEEHKLNDEQKELYRTATRAWSIVLENAGNTISNITNGGGEARGNFLSQFYGAQQRFFNLLITTLKIPTCVDLANKALADGKAVVISLVNTNEAAQNREKNKAVDEDDDDEIPDYDFGPKEMLKQLIREHYPVQQWADDVNDNGDPIKVPVYTVDDQGREIPQTNPAAEAARDALLKEIDEMLHMPDNPLDILIQSLGGERKVAELTGRKERYDRNTGEFVSRGDPGTPQKDINLVEMRKFQAGQKNVAILSAAAGTGISLHAGNDVANQKQRYHITLQVGWSADKAMQMFGRTHRTNQKQPPIYVMLVSDLGGEKRFVSTISRRLGSLGALTKGQKNATGGTDLMDKVNFETDQGRQATNTFYERLLRNIPVPGAMQPVLNDDGSYGPELQQMTGMQVLYDLHVLKPQGNQGMTVPPAERTNVTRLLNRLLALDPDIQNSVYNYFYDIFQATVQDAIDRGQLDTGVKSLPGDEFAIKESRVISKDSKTGAETLYYPVDVKVRTHRVSPKDLNERMVQHARENPTLIVNDKGQVGLLIDAPPIVRASGSVEPAFYYSRPGKGEWIKLARTEIPRNADPVDEWAQESLREAEQKAEDAQRSVEYRKEDLERGLEYERGRRARILQERVNQLTARLNYLAPDQQEGTRRELETAQRDLDTAKGFTYPEDDWHVKQVRQAENTLAEAVKSLDEAKAVAEDPIGWAKDRWAEQYEQSPSHVTHEHHLIGGAVLKFWNAVNDATGRPDIYTAVDSKTGKRIVGVDIPKERIGELLNRISGGASTVNGQQLIADVLRNGLSYTLEGGIQVRQGRVGREQVIQVIPPNKDVGQTLIGMGVKYEKGLQPIYYVPNQNAGPVHLRQSSIVDRILEQYPVQAEQHHDQGPPRLSRETPGNTDTSAPVNATTQSAYRNGVVWVSPLVMKAINRLGGFQNAGGVFLPQREAADLLEMVRNDSLGRDILDPLQKELEKAIAADGNVVIIQHEKGKSLARIIAAFRHEMFHRAQGGAGGITAGKLLLRNPLAQKAASVLGKLGYDPSDEWEMWAEIGAHLAGGPADWRRMGLTREEAKDLFREYARILDDRTVARIQQIAPQLKGILHAERELRQTGREASGAGSGPAAKAEGSAQPGELRPGIRQDVSTGGGPRHSRLSEFARSEAGTSTVADLVKRTIERFHDEDTPNRNYSGLGGLKAVLLPGSKLTEVEQASKPVFEKALAAGSWQSIASTMTRTGINAINEALKGTDNNWIQMRAMLTQDRLDALRDRWQQFADMFEFATKPQLEELIESKGEGGQSFFLGLLSNIEGRNGLGQDLGQTAAALLEHGDLDNLRDLMVQTFRDASAAVTNLMSPEEFDVLAGFFENDPQGKAAIEIYRNEIEHPLERIHQENEGVMGPKGRRFQLYIPLVAFEPKPPVAGGRRLPLHKPKNPNNNFATGLSSSYDIGMPGFIDAIARSVRANKRALLVQTLRDEGWAQPKPQGWDGRFFGPDGKIYKGVAQQVSEARTLIKDGKVIHIPGRQDILPEFLWKGLKPILQKEPMSQNDLTRVSHFLNGLALKATPAELVFHSAGLLGAINANTPFIGKTGLDKFLSAPVLRAFAINAKLLAMNPESPENIKKLRELAEAGALPSKMGKVTFDKKFAEEYGVKREISFGPFLFGPSGIDVRARILMYDIFKAAYPNGSKADLYHFVNQLGNYTPEFQGEIERFLKSSGIGPFATAGMTRAVNAFHAWTGTGPGSGRNRILQMLFGGGAIAALAIWILAYHYLTGKWPNQDKRAKLFQIPVGGGHGMIDHYRHSKIGNLLWGKGPETGYLNLGAFFPLVGRGARLLGFTNAFQVRQLGGNQRQITDAMELDAINSLLHPAEGPALTAAWIGVTGTELYASKLHEGEKPAFGFMPAYPDERKPGFLGGLAPALVNRPEQKHSGIGSERGAKTARVLGALNGFYQNIGEGTGMLGPDSGMKGAWYVRVPLDLMMPGVVKNASNPFAKAVVLRRQQAGEK